MVQARSFGQVETPVVAQGPSLLDKVEALAVPYGLMTMGAAHIKRDQTEKTIVLVGTAPTFWQHFIQSDEHADGAPDPIDRWSERIMPKITKAAGGVDVVYPFGGPPYAPFLSWAKLTGEAFDSPVGMLVHARAGLMLSYRGAVVFNGHRALPALQHANPCDACASRPCVGSCPVDALSDKHFYNVPDCKAHINTPEGESCMTQGCISRLSCPVSQSFGRPIAQTTHHMRAFKGA